MTEINYNDRLIIGKNGREVCSLCKKTIPANMKRISFSSQGMYGSTKYTRLCAECLVELAGLI